MVYFAFAKRIMRRGRIGERRRTSSPLKKRKKNRERGEKTSPYAAAREGV